MQSRVDYFEDESPILDKEVLKLYKLRKLITKAWAPMGIQKPEAIDIFVWMIGEDADKVNFKEWPLRIQENTGIQFRMEEPLIQIFRKVAIEWRRRKPMLIITPS